jgi:polysaccharide biosynthesis protein PslH
MANLLFLVHRLPYPPNKGDKVRSFHLLKHLSQGHRVFLGTFLDDPADDIHIETLRKMCPDLFIARLNPTWGKLRSLAGLLSHEALGVRYYRDASLQAWADDVRARHAIDATVVFSSVMAQYVNLADKAAGPVLLDFVDVDSAKWGQYASQHRWPLSWVYHREADRLLAFERAWAMRASSSFFVTDMEKSLFLKLAPECAGHVQTMCNGVDADYYSPDEQRQTPYAQADADEARIPIVFTGAMDYWPNVDAVNWFALDILPALRKLRPTVVFYVVGRNPAPAVLALASKDVVVTGTVDDVRPYLQHAAVVVAPLRVARGIQNKVLEAMAMARPVVASTSCAQAVDAQVGQELVAAETVDDYVREIDALLADGEKAARIGKLGRQRVVQQYSWSAHLGTLDQYLPAKDLEAVA